MLFRPCPLWNRRLSFRGRRRRQAPSCVESTLVDLQATKIINNISSGSTKGFGVGEDGGDLVLVGQKLADSLGLRVGDPIGIISPTGGATAFGTMPPSKTYVIGGLFSVGMSEYDQTFIYMPLTQAQLLFGRDQAVDFIEVKLDDPDKAPGRKAALAAPTGIGGHLDWTERKSWAYLARSRSSITSCA